MRFLLDALQGSGGFQGQVKQPSSGFWGPAAEQYNTVTKLLASEGVTRSATTYLDRHPREDDEKFNRRRDGAHYLNYVRPLTELKVSYATKSQPTRTLPDKIKEWVERTRYAENYRRFALITAALGWFPVLVDMPRGVPGGTKANSNTDPYIVPLLPLNLYDYGCDEHGKITWAKLCTTYVRKPDWQSEAKPVERFTVWTQADYMVHEAVDGATSGEQVSGSHEIGRAHV